VNLLRLPRPRRLAGFTLVELMVALALGLVLAYTMASVYGSTKAAFRRMDELSSMQRSVRTAFEYLAGDARMVGHLGCFTRRDSGFTPFPAVDLTNNYAVGVEGYDYQNSAPGQLTLAGASPANDTSASDWAANLPSAGGTTPMPLATIDPAGLTPGSDVLVIRTVVGRPVRLTAPTTAGAGTISIESIAGGKCSDGTSKVSGLCAGSHALIASCTSARVFSVASITGSPAATLAMNGSLGGDPIYPPAEAEVFPLQTIVYYVKQSSSGSSTSLYRRIFDGNAAGGHEQELIEGVESLQVTYGVDTTVPPDGVIDAYVTANNVGAWSGVVAIRMGLLLRALTPTDADVPLPAAGTVNGVAVTYPAGKPKYDRRVFTTTVAVRNRISYF
jgi:type IV pilus assembly protein PilW